MQVPLLTRCGWLTLVTVATLGCGAEGGTDGGGAGLPDRGIVPYEKLAPLPDDEVPFLVADGAEPAAIVVDGGVELLLTTPEGVAHARSADGTAFGSFDTVATGVGAPAIARDGAGFVLAWEADDAVHVGRTTALTAFPTDSLAVVPGVRAPSVVVAKGAIVLYAVRDLTVERLEIAEDGSVSAPTVVMRSDEDCLDESGDPCFDYMGVDSPEVQVATTALGRTVYRMMYTGVGARFDRGIGFAASFDGVNFSRYPFNPVFSDSGRESQPSNVRFGDSYLLYFQDRTGSDEGLGVARIDADSPSDTF